MKYVLMPCSDVEGGLPMDDAIQAGCGGWTEDMRDGRRAAAAHREALEMVTTDAERRFLTRRLAEVSVRRRPVRR